MKSLIKLLLLFTLVLLVSSTGKARGINFHSDILDEALLMAKNQGKYVFIDTYAQWCGPCKRMNKVFSDERVGVFFNDNFINVKIDMDGRLGKDVSLRYDVVWLPTLLILSPEGEIKYRVDKEVCVDDLLKIGNKVLDPSHIFYDKPVFSLSPMASTTVQSSNSTTKKAVKEEKVKAPEEKILYVFDKNSTSTNPDILYHEAYLRMQIGDPSVEKVAEMYLKTQKVWNTAKNIKFIFDFVETTESVLFEYYMKNIEVFKSVIGEEKVTQNLELMVHMKLSSGFPRPGLSEAKELYTLLNSANAEKNSYLYILQRYENENKGKEYIQAAQKYLVDFNPYDVHIIETVAKFNMNEDIIDKKTVVNWIEDAVLFHPENSKLKELKDKIQ